MSPLRAATPSRSGFAARVAALPRLGLGISTEHGAHRTGLDVLALRRARPDLAGFLEVGVDQERGLDHVARRWAAAGHPSTLHFLDLNLEEPEDLDDAWLAATRALAAELGAAWICGDAGLWHVGPRERGHGTLLPPILTRSSAEATATSVRRLREGTRLEVLPENPPAHVYLGELHLLDYFAQLCDAADSGMLLDVAHLAIYQHAAGHALETGLDGFPLERVVELHVAGASELVRAGRRFLDDDHGPTPLPETWALFEHVIARAPNLRAVVLECERNAAEAVLPAFERLAAGWAATKAIRR
jgi:uncharacterized protein (UPF0276 family)